MFSYPGTLFIFAVYSWSRRKKSVSIIFSGYCTMRNVFGVRSFLALFLYPHVFSDLCIIRKNKIPVQHKKWNILLYRNIYLCLKCVFRGFYRGPVIKKFMNFISVIELLLNQRHSVYSVRKLTLSVLCSLYCTLMNILKKIPKWEFATIKTSN